MERLRIARSMLKPCQVSSLKRINLTCCKSMKTCRQQIDPLWYEMLLLVRQHSRFQIVDDWHWPQWGWPWRSKSWRQKWSETRKRTRLTLKLPLNNRLKRININLIVWIWNSNKLIRRKKLKSSIRTSSKSDERACRMVSDVPCTWVFKKSRTAGISCMPRKLYCGL